MQFSDVASISYDISSGSSAATVRNNGCTPPFEVYPSKCVSQRSCLTKGMQHYLQRVLYPCETCLPILSYPHQNVTFTSFVLLLPNSNPICMSSSSHLWGLHRASCKATDRLVPVVFSPLVVTGIMVSDYCTIHIVIFLSDKSPLLRHLDWKRN